MLVVCTHCQARLDLEADTVGALVRCRACRKSFVVPQDRSVVGQQHRLTPFPIAGLVLLHIATVGLFTVVYLNLLHDRLPRHRKTDPTGLTAVGLSFVPLLNLLWFFFTFRRLCVRINEQRRFRGLPETAPQSLAVIVATLLLCGFVATILPLTGWVVLGATLAVLAPVFIAVLQASVNEMVAFDRAGDARSRERHVRRIEEQPPVPGPGDLRTTRQHRPVEGAASR
ncbi:MAG: hypothetical protein GY778_03750 [bacterium]|nr:hypothetical protein [bacterium]